MTRTQESQFYSCPCSLYDLDRTLVKETLPSVFILELKRKGILSFYTCLKLRLIAHYYRFASKSLSWIHNQAFSTIFKGRSRDLFIEEWTLFWETHKEALYLPKVVDCLKRDIEKGYFVAISSSSPDFIVEIVAKELGVHAYQASAYDFEEGKFSSISQVVDGAIKAKWLKSLKEELNVGPTWVYSDSIQDLEVLQAADHPIAVRPDVKLKEIARKKGWQVMEE